MLYDILHPTSQPTAHEVTVASKTSRLRRKKKSRHSKLPYHQCELSSPHFERYYQAQCIVPKHEWIQFLEGMARDLPACFRLRRSHPLADAARKSLLRLQQRFRGVLEELELGAGCYWRCSVTVRELRRHAEFRELREWLSAAVELGVAYRQEAVSLLPPLFLDVKPGHLCFDMCAAPGERCSSASQL